MLNETKAVATVSGFTFIRNAILYDYPVVEAISSVLPLCDEFIVAVGNSDDSTYDLIRSIPSDKIRIINTVWDDTLREGGRVLALEADKAFRVISPGATWALYIQGDEVVHEKYLPEIGRAMDQYRDAPEVEGLLFNYLHFYGSYDFVGDSRKWYRREVRIVRNLPGISSYRDAQGFRLNQRKLNVKKINASIYHYGWVKSPSVQQLKQMNFNRYWHSDAWIGEKVPAVEAFDYSAIDSLEHFNGSHPEVMKNRIRSMNWEFPFDPTQKKFSPLHRFLHRMETMTGWRIGEYRNYRII
ncbi:MAG: hypothetical protein KBB71_11055 [Lentimicrobiaceae bacterium]|nr:hypothetical protein [Lentimicrobiaceae bacterium]